MPTFDRRFGSAAGTVLEVQATGVTNVTSLSLTGVKLVATATSPKRAATIDITIDGATFEFKLDFTDEAFNTLNLTGGVIDHPTQL